MIHIALADPHELFREGLKVLFEQEPEISVVNDTSTVVQTVEFIKDRSAVPCDVIVLDPDMPGRGGVDLIKQIKNISHDIPVLILSGRIEPGFACRAIRAGASGYLSKAGPFSELLHGVRRVASGRPYISVGVAEQLALDLSSNSEPSGLERLSDRERQVLELLLLGNSLTKIADQLHLSVKTISTHKGRVMDKIKVSTFAEMMHYGISNNLLGSSSRQ